MIKLSIIKDLKQPDWMEATWNEVTTTSVEVEKEVDGELIKVQEEQTTSVQIDCISLCGHREHIQLLEDRCIKYGTELTEEQMLIVMEVQEAYVYPTAEEVAAEELAHKVQEAKCYLTSTDYKMTMDYFGTLSKEDGDELIVKRAEARDFIRNN